MKNAKKILLLVLCAALLVGATVAGTVAYLTSQDTVTNTFTVGKVSITLDETDVDLYGVKDGETPVTANTYKLIPGHTYTKDPTIHVDAESEKCWLFAKIENGLDDAAEIKMVNGWKDIGNGYWAYETIVDPTVNADVTIFTEFTYTSDPTVIPDAHKNANITVTAYAIQSAGFSTSDAAWTALNGQLKLVPNP